MGGEESGGGEREGGGERCVCVRARGSEVFKEGMERGVRSEEGHERKREIPFF